MYSLGQLELETIVLVEYFAVYTLLKTIFLLIRLCHRAKHIFTEFISPQIEEDHCQNIGIIPSWTVFWVCSYVI